MPWTRKLSWALSTLLSPASSSPAANSPTTYKVQIPYHPIASRQSIDSSFQSLSIEFFAFAEYSGNSTYLNPLNINLIHHIRRRGGVPIKVRVGGSSQGSLAWVPSQEQGLIGYYEPGADKTYKVSLGPGFLDLFETRPDDTEFVLGLRYPYEDESYHDTNIKIAKGLYDRLGSRLIGVELGNERNEIGLTPPTITNKFLKYAYPMSDAVFGDANKRIFTIGTFHAPTLIECANPDDATECFSTTSLLRNGINKNGIAARADTHQDMLRYDSPRPTRQYLMNHNNTAYCVDSHKDLAAYSTALGVPYIIGEGNSLFGHGRVDVSDTLAAALWKIDFTLCSAQTNITLLGFHQSFGWRYSAWRPIPAFGYPAGVLPSYYGYWVVQRALGTHGGSKKKVEVLIAEEQFTVYGIYDAKTSALSSVVTLNLLDWSSSDGQVVRPEIRIDLSSLKARGDKAEIYRLTAAGADIKDPELIRFGGQYVNNNDGTIEGISTPELLEEGKFITLRASEVAYVAL